MSITFSVLLVFTLALNNKLGMDESQAVTVSFLTLAFAQLWHIFNMRARNTSLLKNDVTSNPYVWGALGLCAALLILSVYLPPMAAILKLVNPGASGWLIVLTASSFTCVIGQLLKLRAKDSA